MYVGYAILRFIWIAYIIDLFRITAKVYTAPLNLQETPLTLAVNLSAKLGNEIWLKREDMQPVFSFKVRGAYNLMAHLPEEDKWKGVVTCSAGTSCGLERHSRDALSDVS
jgi:threonine dehydratase